MSDYRLKIYPDVNVWLKKKDVSIFIVKLLKPFRGIVVKHPLVAMDLRLNEKPFFLSKCNMVAQMK